ncbi:transposase [Azoarcus sp. CIB]|nr:transposase [Azoarcus sp. CIB]
MIHSLQLFRRTTAPAPEFPAPGAAGCCSMPYRPHSPLLARAIVAPMTAVGADLCLADASMHQSSVIFGTPAGLKSP